MEIQNKKKMIAARVTDKEFKLISLEANKRGQRKSSFIREMIISHLSLYSTIK